jgi:plastocyanin
MKHLFIAVFACILFSVAGAQHIISINGNSYLPNTLTVNVGDEVIIEASKIYPLAEVNPDSWHVNRLSPQNNGFSSSSNYKILITAAMAGQTIYFGSAAHLASGMKGRIIVNAVPGIFVSDNRDFNFTVYPNPVKTDSWINIELNKSERISIQVYDMNGRIVRTFIDQQMHAGDMKMPFTLNQLESGNYIVQMRSGNRRINKQIIVQ